MSLNKAADDLKVFAKRFQGLLDVAKVLEEISSLDQAKNEALRAQEKAAKDREAALAQLDVSKEKLAEALAEIKEAEAEASAVLQKGSKSAADIVEAAKAKASEIMSSANAHKYDIDSKFNAACRELSKVEANIAEKTAEFEELKSQIGSFKSKLKAFVGA